MSEPTVVVVEDENQGAGDDGAGVAFAAGIAAATSEQATATAEQAAADAEGATGTAGAALEIAAAADESAWDARMEVENLRSETTAKLDGIAALLADLKSAGAGAGGDSLAPAPVTKKAPPAADDDKPEEKPAEKRYGSKGWFG